MSKNILIVNDDGIHSEGIIRLARPPPASVMSGLPPRMSSAAA